jgi:CNT family concentrative nucleoside transporter
VSGWGVDNARAIAGAFVVMLLAWALGGFKRLPWRVIISSIVLEIVLTAAMFGVPPFRDALNSLSSAVDALSDAAQAGSSFVFGYLGGGAPPFAVAVPGNQSILAFNALTMILLISALSAVLWHWGVLQVVCKAFAWVFQRFMSMSGPASLGVASNVFLGMVESPILIRPYLATMTNSELFVVMVAGLATVAGTVMVIYAQMLEPVLPGATGHIVAASILNSPSAVLIAALMVPPLSKAHPEPVPKNVGEPITHEDATVKDHRHASTIDALVAGVTDGLQLWLSVIAMLLVFVALVALVNSILHVIPPIQGAPLTVERVFGWMFQPVTWAIGIPWKEAGHAGSIYGVKTVLNEFIAYQQLSAAHDLSPRTTLILTYALCGFANFGALGIMMAGMVTMTPSRRVDILRLGPLSLVAGSLATLFTGAVIGAAPASFFALGS